MNNKQTNKKVAVVLGGTYPHKSLLTHLKNRGYHTILIDYLEYSPAIIDADEHIRHSTLDKENVLRIAKIKKANLVISACIDQANVTACYVGEQLGLPIPYTYKQALMVSNKVLMKRRMIECDIPTAKYREFSSLAEVNDSGLRYPLIVKPSDSNSSKGVRRVESKSEMIKAANLAFSISRDSNIILEEYIIGKEIGVDCLISSDEARIIMTRERRKITCDTDGAQQIQGSFWPTALNQKQFDSIQKVVSLIAHCFELKNTILMAQLLLVDDDVFVIEFAPRIGGGESFKIIEILTGCDVIDLSIDSFLHKPFNFDYKKPKNICADIYLYAYPAVFDRIDGFEKLMKDEKILYWHQYKKSGFQISEDITSNNRIGSFVVEGGSENDIVHKINEIIGMIAIKSKEGHDILRRQLYF